MRWELYKSDGVLTARASLPLSFDYAVIDLETTGLNPRRDRVIAFGWVRGRRVLGAVALGSRGIRRVYKMARYLVSSALDEGIPVYAWHKEFEESFLRLRGLKELQVREREKKDLSLSWGLEPPAEGRIVPLLWRKGDYWRVLNRAIYDALIEAASLPRSLVLELYRGGASRSLNRI